MKRLPLLLVVLVLLATIISPLLAADPPLIRIAPVWRPPLTLDSIDLGTPNVFDAATDDFRYVDVEIYVTASVEFWTAQLTCTVTPAALTSYEVANTGNADTGDDLPSVRWGPEWGVQDTDFTAVVEPMTATGSRRITAAHFLWPLGSNGSNHNFLLATLRYRAKDLAANGTSVFTCTSSFLNQNGQVVVAATYVAPPVLNVITGYTISAQTTYQGRASAAGIGLSCDGPDADDLPDFTVASTNANGTVTYNALRQQGWFACWFFGNVNDASPGYQPDAYLSGYRWFKLTGSSFQFMQEFLRGGNTSRNDAATDGDPTTHDENISAADLGVITAPANWEKVSTAGDINGDGKTDRADLSIAAGNFGWGEGTLRPAIFGLQRNYDVYRNNRIWLSGDMGGTTTQFVPGTNKDFWPTVSYDGTKIAFVRDVSPAGEEATAWALFVAPISPLNVVGTPVRLTPVNGYPANFAPSWSLDSSQIAFNCSWWSDVNGFETDNSDLCVVDTNGRNLRTVGHNARISPPAWYVNNAGQSFLVYGGSPLSADCPNTLCIKDPLTPDWWAAQPLDSDIPSGGSNIADMPHICNMQGCDHLFYRYNNGTNRVIRWAQIDLNTNDVPPFETRAGAVAPFHVNLEYDTDGDGVGTTFAVPSIDVDYFAVAQNNYDVMYYDFASTWQWNTIRWSVLSDSTPPSLIWWYPPSPNSVIDQAGNLDPNDVHYNILRNTVDIVP